MELDGYLKFVTVKFRKILFYVMYLYIGYSVIIILIIGLIIYYFNKDLGGRFINSVSSKVKLRSKVKVVIYGCVFSTNKKGISLKLRCN